MNKVIDWTLYTCGGILFLTGVAKLISGQGTARILHEPDPVFGFSYSALLLSVGMVEVVVGAACCLRRISQAKRVVLLAWITGAFALYRTALWLIDAEAPCMCLGSLTKALNVSSQTASLLTNIAFGILVLGSGLTVFGWWRTGAARRHGA